MLVPWFLVLLAGSSQEGVDAFEKGLEAVRRLEVKEKWERARQGIDSLLEEHRDQEYVLHRLPEIREEVRRIHFWLGFEVPDPDELVGGELLRYSPSTGQVKIRYRVTDEVEGSLSDFIVEREGLHHPLFFETKVSITLKGEALDESVTLGFGNKEALVCVYLLHGSTHPTLALAKGDHYKKKLDNNQKVRPKRRAAWELKLTVRKSSVSVTYNGKRLLGANKLDELRGHLFFWGPQPNEIFIEGNATTAWIEGLASDAIEEARARFDQEFDLAAELPGWLQDMDRTASVPTRLPYPDGGYAAHWTAWEEVVSLVAEEQLEAARQLVHALDQNTTTELFRAYALACIEAYDDRYEDALCQLAIVQELEPDFSAARVLEARIHIEYGRTGRAHEILSDVTIHDPLEVEAWRELIQLELYDDADLAKRTLDRALEMGIPPVTLAHLNERLVRAKNGPRWGEIFDRETKHYRVVSNLNFSICADAAKILEEALQLYRKDFPRLHPRLSAKRRYSVYLFAGEAGFQSYVRDLVGERIESAAGLYHPAFKQLLIWNLPDREGMLRTIRHEGFHQFLHSVIVDAPPWLDEGLAEYYEVSDPSRGFAEAGRPRADYIALLLKTNRWAPMRRFVVMCQGEFMQDADLHYVQAWALNQFLMQSSREERSRLDRYLKRLVEGVSWEVAAEAILEGRDGPGLRQEVRQYLVELRDER